MGTPSGFENRGTLTGTGSSSLPFSAKCSHDRDNELCDKCYLDLLELLCAVAAVRGIKPSVLETAIRHVHMEEFMRTYGH